MAEENYNEEMKEIVDEFICDTTEELDNLENKFIELENNPDDLDLLNEIFRTVHSVKGAAGFLGFDKLVEIAHDTESVLNKLRRAEFKVTANIMDIILDSVDQIKIIVSMLSSGDPIGDFDVTEVTTQLKLIMMDGEKYEPVGYNKAGAAQDADIPEIQAEPVELIKESEPPQKDAPEEESVKKMGEILVEEEVISKEDLMEALEEQEQTPKLGEVLVQNKKATPEQVQHAVEKQQVLDKQKGKKAHEIEQTIRVEIRRLDNVMNLVGELVLGRNRLLSVFSKLENIVEDEAILTDLSEISAHINLVTSDLQLAVMKTRMQPIRKVFAKFPKLVRTLSREFKKNIKLEIYGESTELDKSVIEVIGDPLVHLIRNSVDHGIESQEARAQAGKSSDGRIILKAEHEGNNIVLTIKDNGKGIDVKGVQEKAIERGLIHESEVEKLSKQELLNFIFEPGFSTAKKVTSVSGRGVGMDVVKTNITRLNGTIEIDSDIGVGTTITLKLPLTVAIIQALMIGIDKETYAIPLSSISETLYVSPDEMKRVNQQDVIKLRESILPLIRLDKIFKVPNKVEDNSNQYIVVLSLGERKIGLIVDKLIGQEEIVIKSMGDFLRNLKGISGATITGDGKVILIVDVQSLMLSSISSKAGMI